MTEPGNTKQLCLIGAGRIAQVHARSVASIEGLSITAVVDPALDAAKMLAARFGAECYSSFPQALGAKHFDGVIVAAPTGLHADLIEASVAAGLPVFCEKPVDLDLARVDRCVDLVAKHDVPVLIGFHRRFDAARGEIHELAVSGALGRLEHVLQISRDPRLPPESFIAHSGGIVRDMLIHDLDELIWLCGAGAVEVQAHLERFVDPNMLERHGDFDSAAITIVFDNGPQCQLSATRRSGYGFEQRLEVFGATGLAICPSTPVSSLVRADATGFSTGRLLDGFQHRYAAAYCAEMEHFSDILEGRATSRCTVADARASLVLAEAVLEAATLKRTVSAALS